MSAAAPPVDAVLAAGHKALGTRTLEAIVNDAGVVELYVVVQPVASPSGPDEIALDQARAHGIEADDGDELLFPVYYLPDDEDKADDQQQSGFAALLEIPVEAFHEIQRELAPWLRPN